MPDHRYDYEWHGYGMTITTPAGTCFLQGEEASELHDRLEACTSWKQVMNILSAYEHVCE